jgi:hypothetical protein
MQMRGASNALPLCLVLLACGPGGRGGAAARTIPAQDVAHLEGKSDRIVGPACMPAVGSQTITFVHVNDLHASYHLGKDGVSPYARIRGFFEAVRRENPYALLTDGGDDHEKGSAAELLSNGASTIDATRLLGFDVRVLGNHDFAWGADELLAFSRDPHGVVLASNTRYLGGRQADFSAHDFATVQVGCVRIGLFGMVTKPWNESDTQVTGDFLPEFRSRWDWSARAAEIVAAHRSEVDLMVMVSHLGLDEDQTLAAEVPGIDVVLGGHSHQTTLEPATGGGAVIVQAGSSGAQVARLDVEYDPRARRITGHRLAIESVDALPVDIPTNEAISATLKRYAPNGGLPLAWVKASRGKRDIARIAARAAVETEGLDAAMVDERTVWSTWSEALALDQQALLDAFKVQREPSNTPGSSSLYVARIDGASLARLARALPATMAYFGPRNPIGGRSYRLGLQKRAAMHPRDVLPPGVSIERPVFANEMWRELEAYGRARTASCRHVDSDSLLDGGCPSETTKRLALWQSEGSNAFGADRARSRPSPR